MSQAFPDDSYVHKDAYINPSGKGVGGDVEPPEFWTKSAEDALTRQLDETRRLGNAKNLILFLGDGWGVPTITAARILKGQSVDNVKFGEEGQLHVETFPHTGMSKTFCSDAQTADSACSATAYLCGVKANTGTIGVNSNVKRNDCTAQMKEPDRVSSILAWAQAAGKSTGIVTTTRITHASPAGTYAHIANRGWESDSNISGQNTTLCDDIAEQLILKEPGKNITVILGGGRAKFLPNDVEDAEGKKGVREDKQNLIEIWKSGKTGKKAEYIQKASELKNIDPNKTDYLLGLFSSDHLSYHNERDPNHPTLTDMTEKAIQILSKNPNGFFLFVEGGKIDLAHHDNKAFQSIVEAVEFDKAIKKGDELTNDEDTLIVVTADHSHAFTFHGYGERGSNITDFAGTSPIDEMKFSKINYANGPGHKNFTDNKRHNISNDDVHGSAYSQVPLVPLDSETHGGEDVMIFAKGPFSHLLSGVHMQSYIPRAMSYAGCIGSGINACKDERWKDDSSSGKMIIPGFSAFLICSSVIYTYIYLILIIS